MNIKLLGINHKTAPIGVREKFFLNATQQDLLLSQLKSHPSVIEGFVFSTCNRTEVYVHMLESSSTDFILKVLADIKEMRLTKALKKHFYFFEGQAAVEHLLQVATGMDSLVIGEKQILGQVKDSFERARAMAMLGKYFNILSNLTVRTGKKAQAETAISAGGSSVSWAATVMAERTLGELKGKKVLIIGAGKMSALAISQIHQKGLARLYIMNRTQETGEKLATKFNASACAFCDIKEILSEVDVCICSTDAPHYILDRTTVEKVMPLRQSKKLIFFDISMPRNIDPQVGDLAGAVLYTIDDLDKIVDENMRRRQNAAQEVHKIIAIKMAEFYAKLAKVQSRDPEHRLSLLNQR